MSTLVWETNPRYESGVSHGVFYPAVGPGIPWNGLISIVESIVGGEHTPLYIDGLKYADLVSHREFQATVTAISAPREFGPYNGKREVAPGLFLTKQRRSRFNFTYRTEIGDGLGYRIHLVNEVLATPQSQTHSTTSASPAVNPPSWRFDAVPMHLPDARPMAHWSVDSTKAPAELLQWLEEKLYGTETEDAAFPNVFELAGIFGETP